MENRINALDYVRVVAITMILMCHYFLFSELNNGISRYFAGTGNMLFFLVSAVLFGYKYRIEKQDFRGIAFIKKRTMRLGASVWPFLLISVVLYLVFKIPFSWVNVGLNFLFLGYFGRLPGNGHLWFLTVLMACYLELVLLMKLKEKEQWVSWIILVLSVIAMTIGERLGVPSGAFFNMGLFGFVFLNNDLFLRKSRSMKWWMAVAIVIINTVTFFLEFEGLFAVSRSIHFILTGLCGLTLLALMMRFLPNKSSKVVSFFCGISFEIYLVHHTLCAGPFVRITYWPYSHLLNFAIMVLLTIVLAVILKLLSSAHSFD